MLFLRSICVAATIVTVCALSEIPYDKIHIQLVDQRMESFESEMKRSLSVAKNFWADTGGTILIDNTKRVVSLFSVFVAEALPYLINHFAGGSGFKEALMKAIPEESQRAIAENDIRNIQSALESMSNKIEILSVATDLTTESRIAMVHIIHDKLDTIVYQFLHENSIFRKYPLIVIPPMFAIASFIAIFDPIAKEIVPAFASKTTMSCNFLDALKQYRNLAVHERLKRIEVYTMWNDNYHDTAKWTTEAERLPYRLRESDQSISGTLGCDRGCENRRFIHERVKDRCLVDRLGNKRYYAGQKDESPNCILGYMKLVKLRLEKAFLEPINLIDKSCSRVRSGRPQREPTGYGWVDIKIDRFVGRVDAKGHECDDDFSSLGFKPSSCDPYVEIYIKGKKHFQTSVKDNTNDAYFNEPFKSRKIHKNSKIRFEVWDKDEPSDDDLMLKFETSIFNLYMNSGRRFTTANNPNGLYITTTWKDEMAVVRKMSASEELDWAILADYNTTRVKN